MSSESCITSIIDKLDQLISQQTPISSLKRHLIHARDQAAAFEKTLDERDARVASLQVSLEMMTLRNDALTAAKVEAQGHHAQAVATLIKSHRSALAKLKKKHGAEIAKVKKEDAEGYFSCTQDPEVAAYMRSRNPSG